MSVIYLLCAYSKTGKDIFYYKLQNNINPQHSKWILYSKNNSKHFINNNKYVRVSLADNLKIEAAQIYNIPFNISDDEKDIKQFTHYITKQIVSARDIYIEWADIRKKEDINYWVKKTVDFILTYHNNDMIVVTDWRFMEELLYFQKYFENIFTVRLCRPEITEPPLDIISEHNLDNYTTDILLISDILNNAKIVLKRFPQYSDYNEKYII
jgi:hypothetical protein